MDVLSFYSDRVLGDTSKSEGGIHLGLGIMLHRVSDGLKQSHVDLMIAAIQEYGETFALHPHHVHPDHEWAAEKDLISSYASFAAIYGSYVGGEARFGTFSEGTWRRLYKQGSPTLSALVAIRLADRSSEGPLTALAIEAASVEQVDPSLNASEFWVSVSSRLLAMGRAEEAKSCLTSAFRVGHPTWSPAAVVISREVFGDTDTLADEMLTHGAQYFDISCREMAFLWAGYMLSARRDALSTRFFSSALRCSQVTRSSSEQFLPLLAHSNACLAHERFGNRAQMSTIHSDIEHGPFPGAALSLIGFAQRRAREGDPYGSLQLATLIVRRSHRFSHVWLQAALLRANLLNEFGRPHHALRMLGLRDDVRLPSSLAVDWHLVAASALRSLGGAAEAHELLHSLALQMDPWDSGWSRLTLARARMVAADPDFPVGSDENILLDLAEKGAPKYVLAALELLAEIARARGNESTAAATEQFAASVRSGSEGWREDPSSDGPVAFCAVGDLERRR